ELKVEVRPAPADTDAETFIPVAPYGHEFQGYYDLFSWQNNHDTYIKAWAAPWKTLRLHADFHLFRLDEEQDAWYNAAGSVVQQDAGGTSGKQLGTELDLHAKWTCGDSLSFWTGWSHFWPGRFVNNTSGRSQGDFLFFQMELLFGSS
ncbi:MAG: alginate export family protein, partial [Planctomycetota bacterium]